MFSGKIQGVKLYFLRLIIDESSFFYSNKQMPNNVCWQMKDFVLCKVWLITAKSYDKKTEIHVLSALSLFKCHLYWDSQKCCFVPVHYRWKLPWMFCGSHIAAKILLNVKVFESKKTLIFERSWRCWRDLLESLEWFFFLFVWFVELKVYEIDFALFRSDPVLLFTHLRCNYQIEWECFP